MKIDTITVDAPYCFGSSPLVINDLTEVNFIFAPNGAGKSTISKTLARQPNEAENRKTWEPAPTNLTIRVFNEEYRSRILNEHVDGIFTIGDKSESISNQIEQLESEKLRRSTERDERRKKIGSSGGDAGRTGLRGQIASETERTLSSVFEAHKTINSTLIPHIFKGVRKSKRKFLDEALSRAAKLTNDVKPESWKALSERAEALEGELRTRELLSVPKTQKLLSDVEIEQVESNSKTTGSGRLAELINKLDMQAWVNRGRSYAQLAEDKCPFCQTKAPTDLETELQKYFQDSYDLALNQAKQIKSNFEARINSLESELASLTRQLESDSTIDSEPIIESINNLQTIYQLIRSKLAEKIADPTKSVPLPETKPSIESLISAIELENQAIVAHNSLVKHSAKERRKLSDDGWTAFLCERSVSSDLKRYNGIVKKLTESIRSIEDEIEASLRKDEAANIELNELRNSISNTSQVADNINDLLSSMGFHRFQLTTVSEPKDGYRIVRHDGSPAFESLSEGEKTFICFAYYWESLFGGHEASGSPEEVVAVIDDPISSLDSDSLFLIASYIREAAKTAIEGSSNLRQIIVLTHNTQFHHEAAYTSSGDTKNRKFYRLIKNLNGYTTVTDDGNRSKIRGSYPMLWHSVVEAARTEDESDLIRVGIFNIVRRIIEGYFKQIGNVRDFDWPSGVTPTERRVLDQFHIWANSGSHTTTDDIDITIDISNLRRFLTLFKQYFDLQGHSAHFDMMVASSEGSGLLLPGEIFERISPASSS